MNTGQRRICLVSSVIPCKSLFSALPSMISENAAPGFAVLTLFYLVYTGAGLVTLWLAVLPLDRQAIGLLGARAQTVARAAIFLLCALGVYMGFVLKLNSWQILTATTLVCLGRGLATLFAYPLLWTLIVAGAGVLWVSYAVFVRSLRGWELP